MTITVLHGDCRDVLGSLPANSVHACITSPPYYGLRNYGVDGQIGLEATLREYIAEMVAVFREVRRVLRDDATLWLNLGDSYNAAGRSGHGTRVGYKQGTNRASADGSDACRSNDATAKPKDLLMVPARVALALQADGWWLRSDIIWAKPNPMPESVTDRPTSAHEHVFLLAKAERYFFDADAVREPTIGQEPGDLDGGPQRNRDGSNANEGRNFRPTRSGNKVRRIADGLDRCRTNSHLGSGVPWEDSGGGRNIRNVWTIATAPFAEAHFATFPPALVERCIKAGTSERGCCPACGAPWARIVQKGAPDLEHQRACGGDAAGGYDGKATKDYAAGKAQDPSATKARILAGMTARETTGWLQTCKCPAAEPIPCTVLDPFLGAGTTALVADRLQRDAIGIELNPDYVTMARERCRRDAPLFAAGR